MKRRILSIITALAMCLSLCPTWALAAEADSGGLCPHHREHSYEVCGYIAPAEGHPCGHIHDENCGYVEAAEEVPCDMGCSETGEDGQIVHVEGCAYVPAVEGALCQHEHDGECGYVEAVAGQPCGYVCRVCPVQALIDALPDGDRITGDNRANVEAQLAAIDEVRAELTDEEIDALNITRYAAVVSALAALDGQAGADVPVTADTPTEQFPALTPGGTYWFDLSGAGIPGDKNRKIPDTTLHWVPFTYTGTINAYVLNRASSGQTDASEAAAQATTASGTYGYTYDHSLFIADHAVTDYMTWNDLNASEKSLIFGTPYTSGGVSYTMRAPSVGSNYNGLGTAVNYGTPQNNEWDVILDNNTGYIKNLFDKFCLGQDTISDDSWIRAIRGCSSARTWSKIGVNTRYGETGFRPVLELPSSGTLTFKTVTVDLNGGKIGTTTDSVKLAVKSGSSFTAPSDKGLTGPDGNTFTAFSWRGSDGNLYAPGAEVPASVNSLTALWQQSEETPAIEIDYEKEALTGFDAGGSYTINGTSVAPTAGTLAADSYMGQTISIMRKGNGITTVDSDPQSLTVPPRPDAPAGLQGVNTGFAGENTGQITGLTSGTAYQISSDGGKSWTDKTGPTITDLAAGTYQVRTKATTSAFTGEPASVTIGSGPARTYTLTVTAPAFDAADYGYTQPAAGAVTIKSTGNSSATITNVTVSGGDFTIGGSGNTVTAGSSITSWTVQPNANLNVGTHTATITVTYDGGATATADVSFTVSPRAEDTPNISINYQDETLTGFETGASYTISGVAVTPNSDTLAAAGYMGQTISIVRTARDANYTNSSSQSLNVPARPAEPAVPLKLTKTANSITITNTSSYPDCEFSTDGTNWSDSGAFSGLTAGTAYTIQVRVKATGTSFRSASMTQAVTTVAGDGSTAVKPGESAETGGSTITNDGAEIIITGGDGTTTTITPPAAGGAVNVGSGGAVNVPGGSTVQTGSGPEITVGPGNGGTVGGDGGVTVPDGGTIQIGNPATTITPPTGGAVTPNSDGTVTVPSGSTVQTGDGLEITVGPGNGGTVGDGGGVTVPDGGTIQIGTNPPSTITPPSGEAVTPNEDGTVTIPGGSTVQTGSGPEITVGPGNGGTVGGDGGVTVPGGGKVTVKGNPDDTTITLPSGGGTVKPNPDGTIPLPGNSVVETGGTTTTVPDTGGTYNPSTGTVTENVHTVTFDSQGGSAVNSATATHGGTVAKPANPTQSGYTFGGWFKESGCTNAWNFDTDTVTGDITLYAKWTQNSGGGGSYTRPTYPPTVVQPSEGGGVTVSTSRPERGDTVTVKPAPENGYEVAGITVTDQNGKPVEVKVNSDGTFSFTQPTGRVKIEVTYKPIERPWSNPFTDVSEGDWYYDAVRYVQENGLMGGYGNGAFGPNDILSRAMLAQILYNKEGRPVVNGSAFDDVDSGAWCADAITWAAVQGIVGGYGNGMFGPNDPITREQLAVMLWRYAGSPAATNKELHFNDTDEIGGFALEAMRWAVENGILNGYGDGRLGPKGQATRAQVAQMLMNFLKNQ